MKRSNRAATRDWVNEQRAKARASKLRQDAIEQDKLRHVEAALAKHNQEKSLLTSLNIESTHFWQTVESKAPKLLTMEYLAAMRVLNSLHHHRSIADWEPRGKGRTTIFNSLCDHLLAKFPTPQFLWSAFWEPDVQHPLGVRDSGKVIIEAISGIARGDSFSKMCKSGSFPVTFTNKQCHDFLKSSSDSTFMTALRRTQVQTHGGDIRLLKVLMSRDNCKKLSNIVEEIFLDSVIAWFSKNPMLDLAQFGPLMDYVWYRWREDKTFSMKGRSPIALMRAMQDWHTDLAKRQILHGKEYKPSGFKAGHWEFDRRDASGNFVRVHYTITEILNSKELHAEGKALRHCVLSYSPSIEQGNCSIWSMRLNDERLITIEVRRESRFIVQACCHCNRSSTAEEFIIMQRWAQDNSLSIMLGRW